MWKKLLRNFVFFLFIFKSAFTVRVNIFYETYNEHVRKFMIEQVGPLDRILDEFGSNLEIRFYPYGNTKNIDDNYECQNGQMQCYANQYHMCYISSNMNDALEEFPNDDVNQKPVLSYVSCFFKNRYSEEDPKVLSDSNCKIKVDNYCMRTNSDAYKDLIKFMSDKTNDVQLTNGLAVQIDGDLMEDLETSLVRKICDKLPDNTIKVCETAEVLVKPKLSVYYEANDLATSKYFNKQLFSFYHIIEDFVDIELIPYGNINFNHETYECDEKEKAKCQSTIYQALVVEKYMNNLDSEGDIVSPINRVINFVNCLFKQDSSMNIFKTLEACSNNNLIGDEYRNIIDIMKEKGENFKKVIDTMKQKTDNASPKTSSLKKLPRLPYVKLNNIESLNAFNDVVMETCANYKGPLKPTICNKVNVDVLYAPLDHKTRTIFIEQLKPLFDNLQNLIQFNFVPAGKLQLNEQMKKFNCSPDQCDAFRYHACIVDNYWNDGENYTDPIRQEVFDSIQCMFKNKFMHGVSDNTEFCTELIEADVWQNIKDCFVNDADAILSENIEYTDGILIQAGSHVESVEFPAFVYEGKEILNVIQLQQKVCNNFDDYHTPDYCLKEIPQKISLRLFYQSDSELSKNFFTTQYDPWYLYVEEMINVELIPGGDSGDNLDGSCDNNFEPNSTCFANKIQAFAIDQFSKNPNPTDWIDGTMRTMGFLRCVFSDPKWKVDFIESSESCADDHLAADTGTDLITSAKADKTIYKKALEDTKEFLKTIEQDNFGLLPWAALKVNSDSDQIHSKRAVNDLLQTICNLYQGDKPIECTPVNVEVYYSGYHSQSRRFFVDELIPVYRNLRERIHLDLIPFGTLKNEDKQCSTAACKVNRLQACAIKKYFADDIQDKTIQWDGKNQTLSYIHCMFKNVKNDDIDQLSEECANGIIIQADAIHQCAQNEEGINALEEMKQKTANLFQEMEHAPWIIINGNRVEAAQSDLKKAICDAIIGDVPEYCGQDKAKKVNIQFHYSALDDGSSKKYVLEELYPNYRNLEEIMELDLVSLGQCEVLDIPGHPVVKCDNHDDEAHANLIHACVHDTFWNNDNNENEFDGKIEVVEFLKCYFENENYPNKVVEASEQCVVKIFGDIWSNIHNCANGQNGINILKKYQDEIVENLRPSLTYTPWITVNKIHNYAIENHIQRTVCETYKGREKPSKCYDKLAETEKPNVIIHYEVNDIKSMEFFVKYFKTENINKIGNIELIAFGRSSKIDNNKYVCKNNEDCHSYRQHNCLIDMFFKNEPIRTMNAIACTFESDKINDPNSFNECLEREFEEDIFGTVSGCAKDIELSDKLLENAFLSATSLSKKISHSPWILINNEHNLEAEINILDELCSVYYPTDKPAGCQVDLLDLGVYYQTRDNDVSDFFINELEQYVQYLNEIAKFDFVPYGKTQIDQNGNFKCNSEDQCHANMIHACVIDIVNNNSHLNEEEKILNQIQLGEFLVCTFASIQTDLRILRLFKRNTSVEQKCANINLMIPDIWEAIHECAVGDHGKELMKKMKEKTDSSGIGNVLPHITINNNQKSSNLFFQVVCDSYAITRPPLCRTIKDNGVKTAIFFSGNTASKNYFNNYLKPLYKYIVPSIQSSYDDEYDDNEDENVSEQRIYRIISPELIPWGKTQYLENSNNPFKCDSEEECFINKFFTCAINAHRQEPRSKLHLMEFAICFFNEDNALTKPTEAAAKCTDLVWTPDPFVELEICAKSLDQENIQKMLAMKQRTENFLPKGVDFPAITIDNMYNSQASDKYLSNVLCQNYKGIDPPEYCKDHGEIPSTTTKPDDTTTTTAGTTTTTSTTTTTTTTTSTESNIPDSEISTTTESLTTSKPTGSASSIFSYTIFVLIASLLLFSNV